MSAGAKTALETWEAFNADVSDGLLAAVAGAFAMVACADGKLAEEEVDRFLLIVTRSKTLQQLDPGKLDAHFRALCAAILADFDQGFQAAAEVVATVKDDPAKCQLVIGAAQAAIVADEVLEESEEGALRGVCEALGIDSAGY
jgi:tellurite resistance protein TerB